jgi:hypothetical protein
MRLSRSREALAVAVLSWMLLAAAPPPAPAQEAQWCWKALEGDLGPQDTGLVWVNPSLAARGTEHLWLAWSEEGLLHVRRRTGAGWERIAGPVPHERFQADDPILRLDAAGRPVLLWLSSNHVSPRHLHVARWSGEGWVRLGEPFGDVSEPMLQRGAAALALDAEGRPTVAWVEERDARARTLHVSRWNGDAWERLGREVASGARLSKDLPVLAVDEQGAAWLAWAQETGKTSSVRVARWNGKAWADVGGTGRGALRLKVPPHELQLQLVPGGGAVLAWRESRPGGNVGVALSRWTGKAWEPLASPLQVPVLEPHPRRPALALLTDGRPVLAWSERDDGLGFSYVHVQQLTPEGWRWVFRGLHLDEGQSSTGDVLLEATPDGGFHALVDEPGKDRRLRLLHARPCAPGETPAPLPAMRSVQSFWPTSVDEAAERLVAELDEASRKKVRETPRDKLLQFHMGWGMGIRNSFGLWQGNTPLLKSCGEPLHPDACSTVIIEAVWERLQRDAGP